MKFVQPRTFLIGYTRIDTTQLREYLRETDNESFAQLLVDNTVSPGEVLCSFYAKLCYKSWSEGKNANITRIRDIEANLHSCFDSGHGSVFEHCSLNFVTTNCSRVFTHELVRHRVGTAFSQTSGRYVALDQIDFVHDPILDDVRGDIEELLVLVEQKAKLIREKLNVDGMDFATKKKVTSAIRRIAPNGQANEIGWSVNIRSLRHIIEMRTNKAAEWEIRLVFNQVAEIVERKFPGMLYGSEVVDTGDGLREYRRLRI